MSADNIRLLRDYILFSQQKWKKFHFICATPAVPSSNLLMAGWWIDFSMKNAKQRDKSQFYVLNQLIRKGRCTNWRDEGRGLVSFLAGYFKEHEEVRLPWWRNMTFLSHTQGLDPLPMLQSATKANKSSFDGGWVRTHTIDVWTQGMLMHIITDMWYETCTLIISNYAMRFGTPHVVSLLTWWPFRCALRTSPHWRKTQGFSSGNSSSLSDYNALIPDPRFIFCK